MDLWYAVAKDIVYLYQTFFIQARIKGKEHIPAGPKIIVGNHSLATDAFVLPAMFREKLHFLVQYDLFKVQFIGKLLELADQIPVIKGQGRETLRTALQRLETGHSVVIFPEGRLNHGEQLNPAHAGAAYLAAQSGVPVLPVGFYTPPKFVRMLSARMQDRQTLGGWQFGGPLFVNIGKPLRAEMPSGEAFDVHQFTDQLMSSITELINEIKTRPPQELAGAP
jgi:1-acyl-sn-glycerol-3-phosphate acyltransferase